MSRRKFQKRFHRNISTTGNSFCVTIHQEHIEELNWKKGKEVKTEVINGVLVICDSKKNLTFVDELKINNQEKIKMLESEITALYEEKKFMNEELEDLRKQLNAH